MRRYRRVSTRTRVAQQRYKKTPAGKKNRQEYLREYRRLNPVKVRDRAYALALRKKYGLTFEEYRSMLRSQEGRCAICGCSPSYRLAVDHSHETGAIRGLLCVGCNTSLGALEKKDGWLKKALEYLRSFGFEG